MNIWTKPPTRHKYARQSVGHLGREIFGISCCTLDGTAASEAIASLSSWTAIAGASIHDPGPALFPAERVISLETFSEVLATSRLMRFVESAAPSISRCRCEVKYWDEEGKIV